MAAGRPAPRAGVHLPSVPRCTQRSPWPRAPHHTARRSGGNRLRGAGPRPDDGVSPLTRPCPCGPSRHSSRRRSAPSRRATAHHRRERRVHCAEGRHRAPGRDHRHPRLHRAVGAWSHIRRPSPLRRVLRRQGERRCQVDPRGRRPPPAGQEAGLHHLLRRPSDNRRDNQDHPDRACVGARRNGPRRGAWNRRRSRSRRASTCGRGGDPLMARSPDDWLAQERDCRPGSLTRQADHLQRPASCHGISIRP